MAAGADLGAASVRRLELRGRHRRRAVAARVVRHHRQERLAARGVPALLGQRHLRRRWHGRGGAVPAAPLSSRSAIRRTGRRSTRRSSSCSTASTRSAAGRSAIRCARVRSTASPTTRRSSPSTTTWRRENIDFLLQCYQTLGDGRLLDAIARGMNAFLVHAAGPAAAGLGAAVHARAASPSARAPTSRRRWSRTRRREHRAAAALLPADRRHASTWRAFPRPSTGSTRLTLARRGVAPAAAARIRRLSRSAPTSRSTCIATGSNVVNGRYYVDKNPRKTLGHYSAFRRVERAACARSTTAAKAMPPAEATQGLAARRRRRRPAAAALLDASAAGRPTGVAGRGDRRPERARASGWRRSATTRIRTAARPPKTVAPGDFAQTHVGDDVRHLAVPRSRADGHLGRGLHPQHGRADPRPRRAVTRCARRLAVPAGVAALGAAVSGSATTQRPRRAGRVARRQPRSASAATRSRSWAIRASSRRPAAPPWSSTGWTTAWSWRANPLPGWRGSPSRSTSSPAAGRTRRAAIPARAGGRSTENRALVELRMRPDGSWALDTFLRSPAPGLTLLDRAQVHAPDAGTPPRSSTTAAR